MDEKERIVHAELCFSIDLANFPIDLSFYTETEWDKFLQDPTLDRLGFHKPYGVLPPIVNLTTAEIGTYPIRICPQILVRPLANFDDESFFEWVKYWVVYLAHHFRIIHEALSADEWFLPQAELERRVDLSILDKYPKIHAVGCEVRKIYGRSP